MQLSCFLVQGLSVPFACIGSGDPVRVLRLSQWIHWIYFEAFIAETYVQLAATDANVLRAQALRSETSYLSVRCPGTNWLANASACECLSV